MTDCIDIVRIHCNGICMRNKLLLTVVLFFFIGCRTVQLTGPKYPDDAQRPFLGIEFFSERKSLEKSISGFHSGLLLSLVYPGTPAYKSGLRSSDIIVAIDQKKVSDHGFKLGLDFTEYLARRKIGTQINFTVLRDQKIILELSTILQGRKYSFGESYSTQKEFAFQLPVNHQINDFQTIVRKYKIEKEVSDLSARFKLMTEEGDQLRHPIVTSLQKNPFEIQRYSHWVKQQLDKNTIDPIKLIGQFLFDYNNSDFKFKAVPKNKSAIDQFVEIIKTAKLELDKSFDGLSATSLESLKTDLPVLAEKFSESIYIQNEKNSQQLDKNLNTISLIQKIRPRHSAQGFAILSNQIDLIFLEQIRSEAKFLLNKNQRKQVRIKTSLGDIIVSGSGIDTYTFKPEDKIFLIIDLDGDDIYQNANSIIIDYNGNDIYESSENWISSGSVMGIQFIMDLQGDDRYTGLQGSFASTLFGISFLLDKNGNDEYRCIKYCFATGFGGTAILIDERGDDRYESLQLSQGVGIAGGYGLMLDLAGNDSYYSKGNRPSGYGDAGQFDGWSQGIGVGLRGFVSGGLGLLYDRQGQDVFDSGDFSQGGGYYFGWGLLINSGNENDKYIGSRYSQGFTAHYAIGTFLEAGGNDQYISKHIVGQGMSWDLGITLFQDFSGDDNYKTCPHCLGAASQSGFTFFIDSAGKDTYKGISLPAAEKNPNDYHSGISLGFFMDQGNSADSYEVFKNNSEMIKPNYQILIDQ